MKDLNKIQIENELESKSLGAERALIKLEKSLERDEGSTNHGKKILYSLYKSFQEDTSYFVESQTKKNLFYANYYFPAEEYYSEMEEKYNDVRIFLSHPFNLVPYTLAREITKSISKDTKLTNVAKTLMDTMVSSYNLETKFEPNLLASTVAFVRYLVENASEMLEIYHNERSTVCIRFKEEIKEKSRNSIENIQPHISYEPMIVEPINHQSLTDNNGGYLVTNSPLLKHPEKSIKGYKFDLTAINKMQSTPYRINKDLYELYDSLGLLDIEVENEIVDKIKSKNSIAKKLRWDSKNENDDFIKELQKINADKLEIEAADELSEYGKKSALLRTITLIKKFKDYERIWFPLFCDNRGRVYNYCTDLSVQGTKLGKHIIEFAEGIEITKSGFDALMIAFGGVCGADKNTFETRYALAESLLPMIDAFFEEDDMSIIEKIDEDEIYYGLGLILEIYKARTIENYVSHFIVYVDSCASGTQISALLTRSKTGAELSNLYNPTDDKLTDAYTIVAKSVKEQYEKISNMTDLDLELMLHYKLEELYKRSNI